jgi:hypothetical protein
MNGEQLPYWCTGKCQIRLDHVSPDETDLVCLSCTLRKCMPSPERSRALVMGWDAFQAKAQRMFEQKALKCDAASRRQSR